MTATLEHRHYEIFELPEAPDRLLPDHLAVTFLTDREGDVVSLSAPLNRWSRISCSRVVHPANAWMPNPAPAASRYRSGATTHTGCS